jgi:hypothetical protein
MSSPPLTAFGSTIPLIPMLNPVRNVVCIGAGFVGGPTMAVLAKYCPSINVYVVGSSPPLGDFLRYSYFWLT